MIGLADVWVPTTTLAMLDRAVVLRPDAVALICGNDALTYAQYGAAVDAMAAGLGDVAGRHVAILLPNGIAICVALFAVQRAGAATVALNPDYTARELAPLFDDARPVATVTTAELAGKLEGLAAGRILFACIEGRAAEVDGTCLPAVTPDHLAVIQFTGGTTGRSKGAMLTHRAVATNVAQRECVLPTIFGDERVLCMMPLYHSFAAAMCLHLAAYAAGTLVILPRYRPDWVVEAIAAHAITRLPAGPTIFAGLLNFGLDRAVLTSLRCAYSGSAPLPQAILDQWEARTRIPIYEGYGQSEAGPVLTYQGPGMPLKQGSVGRPLPGTELRIDADTREILARGPQIMSGYLGRPEESAAALAAGWLHTGDCGRHDADGYVFIEDRLKDMAIVGGFNVYPREIDEVLMQLSGMREAAAIGVPDAYRGEVIWAFVAGDIDEPAVRAHCAAHLVKYKHPAVVCVIDALPRTAIGKIDKVALRTLAKKVMADVA